jgi:signal peptidase I
MMVAISLLLFSSITLERDVVGISMQPTLNKRGYYKSDVVYVNVDKDEYIYGDIVVIKEAVLINGQLTDIIKRVVGLPGDVMDIVQCEDGLYRLERNGAIIKEDYLLIDSDVGTPTYEQNGMNTAENEFSAYKLLHPESLNENGKYVVKENTIFVLGDNRAHSDDSSNFGAFEMSKVVGVVDQIRYYGESELKFYFQFVGSGRFVDVLTYILFE